MTKRLVDFLLETKDEFLHPLFKSIIEEFAIVEISATKEKYEELKKILEEWGAEQ